MDGGSAKHHSKRDIYTISWGIVAHLNDTTHEVSGAHDKVGQFFNGSHELFAFIESVKFMMSHNIDYKTVAIFTDDASVCHVNLMYVKYNTMDHTQKLTQQLAQICKKFYNAEILEQCFECLKNARFEKIKGHRTIVYNLRADELARVAREVTRGNLTPILSFEEWLNDGFKYYDCDGVMQRWYAAFSDLHA